MNADTRAARIVGVVAFLGLVGNVAASAAGASVHERSASAHAYSLPSDGSRADRSRAASIFGGTFHARLTESSACAWMGTNGVLWPAGYRIEFNPTRLVDSGGRVVAHQGQFVSAGGDIVGTASWPNASRCYIGENLVAVRGPVLTGKKAMQF
jgi:hypothetical protein